MRVFARATKEGEGASRETRAAMRQIPRLTLVVVSVLCLLVFTGPAGAVAPGDLDPTFGGGGLVTTDFGGTESVGAIAVQSDGGIVAAGTASRGGWALARYLPDGSLDESFGIGGKVKTSVADGTLYALALAPEGKIVVAGREEVARYLPNGTLDQNFGAGGRASVGLTVVSGVAVFADGSMLLAGTFFRPIGVSYAYDSAVVRLTPGGAPDPTFGVDGKVVTESAPDFTLAPDTLVLPDGRFVTVSDVCSPKGACVALSRYLPDGSLDRSFGSGGKLISDVGEWDGSGEALLTADGKMVVVGESSQHLAFVRFLPDGSLDPSFGSGGIVTTSIAGGASSVAEQHGGKIVVATGPLAVARFTADGAVDGSFGTAGVADAGIGTGSGTVIAAEPTGGVIVAGIVATAAGNFALIRYLGDIPPENTDAPGITGSVQMGEELTATAGTWTGTPPGFIYQWQRCDADGEGCVEVPGAAAGSFLLGSPDVGSTIRVAVTAANGSGSATATSAPTTTVVAAPPSRNLWRQWAHRWRRS